MLEMFRKLVSNFLLLDLCLLAFLYQEEIHLEQINSQSWENLNSSFSDNFLVKFLHYEYERLKYLVAR